MAEKKKTGEILVEAGLVSPEQVEAALELQKKNNKKIGKVLVELGLVTDEDVARVLSQKLNLPLVDCKNVELTSELLALVPKEIAEKRIIMPIELRGRKLLLGMADPLDAGVVEELEFRNNINIEIAVSPESCILDALENKYGLADQISTILKEIPTYTGVEFIRKSTDDKREKEPSAESLMELGAAPPVVKLATAIIMNALNSRASDIHIEPRGKYVQVRYRIDGDLKDILKAPKGIQDPLISRLKIISNLDITNRRFPQDGRTAIRVEGKEMDLRISTIPSFEGETIVIRLLDSSDPISITQLGFTGGMLDQVVDISKKPQGLLLVTGPTGSGKTTSLYALLRAVQSETTNIITIEDPIEYEISGVTQIQVNEAIGLTFPKVLRSVFRQDPDIILVGEIRDLDTAEIALRAALTGHLVLSTVHTNDTISTITRLVDIGLPPYLIGSALIGVLAQRLIKKICPNCKVKINRPVRLLKYHYPLLTTHYTGLGCNECQYTGYKGRIGVFELLEVNSRLRQAITNFSSEEDLWTMVREEGLVTLYEDVWAKVEAGMTTFEEAIRKVPEPPYEIKKVSAINRRTRLLLNNLPEADVKIIRAVLEPEGYEVLQFSGDNLLEATVKYTPDLIIVDSSEEAYAGTKAFKSNIRGALTPVVAVSNLKDEKEESKGVTAGIQSYIYRPIQSERLFLLIKQFKSSFAENEADVS